MFRFPVLRTVGRGGVSGLQFCLSVENNFSADAIFKKEGNPLHNLSRGEFLLEKRSANAYKFGDILQKGGAFLLGVN